ncbi:helix-turn-helix domain-containing protein [Candidatus Woesearchaeota archaeon]|nr:helix-turn-helix domain-containing protein [Candidatus Woesearchaeota archaeon]
MKDSLMQLGLTEREADAYLALLHFEEATATQLAKLTKEHRTNIYDSLEQLIKKGLAVYIIRQGIRYYKLAEPEKLIDYLHEKEKIAENILPNIKARLQQLEEKPIVEIYEGREGFKSILMKILRESKPIYAIGASEEWEKKFPIQLEQYMRERVHKRIHAKLLYVQGTKPIYNPLNEIKFLPTKFLQPSTIVIFGDYVAIFMWIEPLVATMTRSQQLSKSFKNYFEILWKIGKK